MKNLIIVLSVLALSVNVFAQDQEAYIKAMKENMAKKADAKTSSDWEQLAAGFDRISQVATHTWVPSYHSIYTYIIASFIEKDGDKRDLILDKAQLLLDKNLKAYKTESEFYALQGFVWQARMSVKSSRGMTYGGKTTEILQKAIKLNPNNPRALYLLGSNILYTPRMFGGGAQKALPHLKKAKEAYQQSKSETPFYPSWGAEDNNKLLEKHSKANES